MNKKENQNRAKGISYAKWGYIFIAPFFVIYLLCHFIPQMLTFYNAFFENFREGLTQIGPNFVGFGNFVKLFSPDPNTGTIDILKYTANTLIIWVAGAIPQIVVALALAVFFTSWRLKIKCQPFFKAVIYMPNLIMAASFSMLFYMIFSTVGPVNQILKMAGITDKTVDFLAYTITVRGMIVLMNFLMWFGNTTILLMAGIMGIDQSYFEAANLDGANSTQTFFKITLPMLKPIIVYTVMTALIGGLQMFDVPQVLTKGMGMPDRTSTTLIMYLNNYLGTSKNFGMSGAISLYIFVLTGIISIFVYRNLTSGDDK